MQEPSPLRLYFRILTLFLVASTADSSPIDQKIVIAFRFEGLSLHTRGHGHISTFVNVSQVIAIAEEIRDAATMSSVVHKDLNLSNFDHASVRIWVEELNQTIAKLSQVNRAQLTLPGLHHGQEGLGQQGGGHARATGAIDHGARDERQALLGLGILLGGVGTALGIYNTIRLEQLSDQIDQNTQAIDAIIHMVDKHEQRLHRHSVKIAQIQTELIKLANNTEYGFYKVQKQNLLNTLAMRAVSLGTETVNAANAAYAQRVDPNIFHAYHMEKALLTLSDKAQAAGYKLLVNRLSDAYQCRASYLARPDGFQLFIHVPMAINTDAWEVYRFVPIPIPIDGTNALRIITRA